MPVRRHIQDEESPRVRESTKLSSLSLTNPSLASQLDLRQRKKRRARTVVCLPPASGHVTKSNVRLWFLTGRWQKSDVRCDEIERTSTSVRSGALVVLVLQRVGWWVEESLVFNLV